MGTSIAFNSASASSRSLPASNRDPSHPARTSSSRQRSNSTAVPRGRHRAKPHKTALGLRARPAPTNGQRGSRLEPHDMRGRVATPSRAAELAVRNGPVRRPRHPARGRRSRSVMLGRVRGRRPARETLARLTLQPGARRTGERECDLSCSGKIQPVRDKRRSPNIRRQELIELVAVETLFHLLFAQYAARSTPSSVDEANAASVSRTASGDASTSNPTSQLRSFSPALLKTSNSVC